VLVRGTRTRIPHKEYTMIAQTSLAALVTVAGIALTTTPAFASGTAAAATGCVSNAEYARLGLGQTLAHVSSAAGADAMVAWRDWSTGGQEYKERLYTMCTPTDRAHAKLTTRFMRYNGAWRAFVIDTLVGPER
jgi:hypothetical protein